MTAEKLRQQLDMKIQEVISLRDKQLELEGQVAKTTRQVLLYCPLVWYMFVSFVE